MFTLWQKQLEKYKTLARQSLEKSRKRYMRDEQRKIIKTQTVFKEGDAVLVHNDHKADKLDDEWALISCTTFVLGLELIPIESDAIFHEKISRGYLYNEKVNVYIGIDVNDIFNYIDTLGEHITETQKHCTTSCQIEPEILSLTNKFNNIKTLGTHLRLLTRSKVKRGLINAIGSISKTLFGTLDSDDLQLINQNIDKLFSERNELKTIVANQTALIRKILNTDSLKQFEKVNQVNRQELLVVKIISMESALSDLHFQLDEILNLVLLGKQGIISPQIMDHHTFLEQYAKALGDHIVNKGFLPEENNFQIILDISTLTLFVQNEKIFFKISIPTLIDSEWEIEQVYSILTQKNGAFLAPLVEHPIFFTSGLTYMNVDQMYLDKQCRIKHELYICKQTQPIHDRRPKHDCASGIISVDSTMRFCKFTVYKIVEITFIPLKSENHYIAAPEKPIKLNIFSKEGHQIVKLKQPSLLKTKITVDILYGDNRMRISGNPKSVFYDIKTKMINITDNVDLFLMLDTLEKTLKIISNLNGYTDTLNQIENRANQLTFSHRITRIKTWGLTTLPVIGYISIELICLYLLNKIGLSKLCIHIFCCKVKKTSLIIHPTLVLQHLPSL
ncbi:uncharacterized protein [Bombus flavifrons]|uniref:uncharacterized protein n=1 Tax=Bombus flavifrons TaxID=103934 RepID=UPI003704B39A